MNFNKFVFFFPPRSLCVFVRDSQAKPDGRRFFSAISIASSLQMADSPDSSGLQRTPSGSVGPPVVRHPADTHLNGETQPIAAPIMMFLINVNDQKKHGMENRTCAFNVTELTSH